MVLGNKKKLSSVGKVIKKRLIDINKSQVWLANEVGMNLSYLRLIVSGYRSGEKYLPAIEKALGLDSGTLQKIA